jgi:hypothetical protein
MRLYLILQPLLLVQAHQASTITLIRFLLRTRFVLQALHLETKFPVLLLHSHEVFAKPFDFEL